MAGLVFDDAHNGRQYFAEEHCVTVNRWGVEPHKAQGRG
jgi:hypothetical protein